LIDKNWVVNSYFAPQRKFMKKLIWSLVIMAAIFASCKNDTKEEETIANETTEAVAPNAASIPSFTVKDVKGNTIDLQSLKGKKVFVNLWATWCPPCRREMPSIQKLSASVDQSKVAFVMLSLDDDFEKAKSYVMENNLMLPIYYPAEQLPELFNVQGIPATFIFDENGRLIKRVEGMDNYDSQQYKKLLN
jgi:thiol-disulfide isomerase/thioredoxin